MPRITWLSTIQQDLRFYNLALPESASLSLIAMDMAQKRSLWRWSTYGATTGSALCAPPRVLGGAVYRIIYHF